MDSDLVARFKLPRTNMKKRDQLGSGGNGEVFKFFFRGLEFAVKWVRR